MSPFRFNIFLLFAFVLPASLAADPYEDIFRDFIVIEQRTADCIEAATTFAEAESCAGAATRACLDGEGDWPHPGTRDCKNEELAWTAIYRTKLIAVLERVNSADIRAALYGQKLVDSLQVALRAELAWQTYSYAQCGLEDLPRMSESYEDRMAKPTFCMERQYAERIFYLRSIENVLPGRSK